MSNELSAKQNTGMALSEDETISVLQSSLYPGAATESVKMVLGYCKAAGLDPFQKPIHIVPLYDSKLKRNKDVIMPGIGLYRTQAARSGSYAGVTEPEFGTEVTETFPEESGYEGKRIPEITVSYPASCKVIVKRLMQDGQIAEFAATERWKENYATAGKNSRQPNSMWARRPYAQLAKCAEAQALRKAFPEVGSAPTADEMEGKEIDMGAINRDTGEVTQPENPSLPMCPEASIDRWFANVDAGKAQAADLMAFAKGKFSLTDVQEGRILAFVALKQNPPIDTTFTEEYEGAEQ